MVMVFVRCFVLFVWFLTRDSSVGHVLPTFWRCHTVAHPGLHHPQSRKQGTLVLWDCLECHCWPLRQQETVAVAQETYVAMYGPLAAAMQLR